LALKEAVTLRSVVEPAQQNRLLPENEENQLAARLVVSGLDLKWVLYIIQIFHLYIQIGELGGKFTSKYD
jgi:hypothetical protein